MDLTELNQKLSVLADHVNELHQQNKYEEAEKYILEVLKLVPQHPIAYRDLAKNTFVLGNAEAAYQYAKLALQYSDMSGEQREFLIYDTLTNMAFETRRFEAARYYGRKAIEQRLNVLLPEFGDAPEPITAPAPPLSDNPEQNIIAFSVFGAKPRYCEVAVLNAQLAQEIYPEWTCRFYVDDSVPRHVVNRLQKYGAQIVDMTGDELNGLFWRFLVAEDKNVVRFLIRDADSLLTYKERAAVDAWIASGKHFHIMRDTIVHTELILAGMWGGCGGILKNWRERIAQTQFTFKDRTIDQQFLRYAIFPTVAQSVLTHDTYALEENSLPFPCNYPIGETECLPYFHIGMIDAAYWATVYIDDTNAQRVRWYLADEKENIICFYDDDVQDDRTVRAYLPHSYLNKIKANEWKIFVETIASCFR